MNRDQTQLFDEYSSVSTSSVVRTHLKGSKTDNSTTRKLKNQFNSAMKAIERLQNEIKKLNEIFISLNKHFNSYCGPIEQRLNEKRLEAVEALDRVYQKKSFSKNQKQSIQNLIIDQMNELSKSHPDVDLTKYEYHMIEAKEHLDEDEFSKELMAQFLKEITGLEDIDLNDLIGHKKLSPEEFAEKYGRLLDDTDVAEAQEFMQNEDPAGAKKVNKFDLHFNKNYKQIAKRIHPDLEQNEEIKKKKEALMKELARAKENKDLFQLICIQSKVNTIEHGKQHIDESYLKEYVNELNRQKEDLKEDLYYMKNNPGRDAWLY